MVTPSKKRKINGFKLHQLTDTKKKRLILKEIDQNHQQPVQQQSTTGEESRVPCHSSIPNVPVKLMNEGVNVCFFNAILQGLVSIKGFRDYLEQSENENHITRTLKDLYNKMKTQTIIKTSVHIRSLNLRNYTFGTQYDVPECLNYLLEHCFPVPSMFDFTIKESIVCERRPGIFDTGCNKRVERDEKQNILQLIPNDTNEQQSVQELLDIHFNAYGLPQEDYFCDMRYGGCGKRGHCTKASLLADVSE
eukprot:TCONS_00016708-protein